MTADSEIMGKVFGVSNMDTVIDGKNGWLYYAATRADYLGEDTLSERGAYNVLHNLSLLQRYVEGSGAKFLLRWRRIRILCMESTCHIMQAER